MGWQRALLILEGLTLTLGASGLFIWSFSRPAPVILKGEPIGCLLNLGNPMATDGKTGRALNVWDLQVFDHKLYVAGGDTVQNSGPINLWAYNLTTQSFELDHTLPEEAIEHFRAFDNKLYIPAADPRRGDARKFYRKEIGGKWQGFLSHAVTLAHVRDLIQTPSGEILMVGNNRQPRNPTKPATAITHNHGESLRGAGLKNSPGPAFNWFFSVFSYRGTIYAPTSLLRDHANLAGAIAVFNPTQDRFELDPKLKNDEFIPSELIGSNSSQQGPQVSYRLWNPLEFQGALVYPVRSYSFYWNTYHAAYMNSIGFYVKPHMGISPRSVRFPDDQAIGEDALLLEDELYVLANAKGTAHRFKIYVYKTSGKQHPYRWQEVLQFQSPNKARAFEYDNGTFYFGLGQDFGDPIGQSGTILRGSAADCQP